MSESPATRVPWPLRRMALGALALTGALLGLAGPLPGQIKETGPLIAYKVRLTLKDKADLKPAQLTLADLPGGKWVGLSYTGVKDPATIAFYGKLGFRTSIAVSPQVSDERLKALEDAGADLVLEGGVGPEMDLPPQEAYDGATMRRLNLMRRTHSPIAVAPYNNMRNRFELPVDRGIGRYLYAIHDSNYLACNSWAQGYKIMARRNRSPEQIIRPHNANRAGAAAPNTLVYYQTIANILQGIVELMDPGEVTTIALRDFRQDDLKKVAGFIGKYGRDPRIWHTTQHEICGYAYLKEKCRVEQVAPAGEKQLDLTIAMEQDTYLGFCPAPLCIKLPEDFPVQSARLNDTDCPVANTELGTFIDVPIRQALADGCTMTLQLDESMTIPQEMPATLTIRNTGGKPIRGARLAWSGNIGLDITGGTEAAFDLEPGAERKAQAVVRTVAGPREGVRPKGARFGLNPISAILTGTIDGQEHLYARSWEVLVAPRLRVEVDPRHVPIAKGDSYTFYVHLANARVDGDRAWGRFSDEKLIYHKTGPCRGTVGFMLPEGMEAQPPEQPFELGANGHATLKFVLRNNQWGDAKGVLVKPAIRFEGEKDPIELPWYGTTVMRDSAMQLAPLDNAGLLCHAAWDDRANTRANLDKASGSTIQSCPGASGGGSTPSSEGVKNWCVGWDSNIGFDAFRNIDYHKGTVMFWVRRDPNVRNEIQVETDPATSWKVHSTALNYGEQLFSAGTDRELVLRRFPRKLQREGYLELVLREMSVRGQESKLHHVQAPFETDKLSQWRHIAIVWDVKERRLELYLDGQLVGQADKGGPEWLIRPWDNGKSTYSMLVAETHHGHWNGCLRDEFCVYDRPLPVERIKANMDLARQAGGGK